MGAALALIAAGKDGEAQRLLAELGGGGAGAPADATAALRALVARLLRADEEAAAQAAGTAAAAAAATTATTAAATANAAAAAAGAAAAGGDASAEVGARLAAGCAALHRLSCALALALAHEEGMRPPAEEAPPPHISLHLPRSPYNSPYLLPAEVGAAHLALTQTLALTLTLTQTLTQTPTLTPNPHPNPHPQQATSAMLGVQLAGEAPALSFTLTPRGGAPRTLQPTGWLSDATGRVANPNPHPHPTLTLTLALARTLTLTLTLILTRRVALRAPAALCALLWPRLTPPLLACWQPHAAAAMRALAHEEGMRPPAEEAPPPHISLHLPISPCVSL